MNGPRMIMLAIAVLAAASAQAQTEKKPGPFASADDKLDYLLNSWTGRSLEELRSVWGQESSVTSDGPNRVFEYQRTGNRANASVSVFGGQVSRSPQSVLCTASFEVDEAGTIVQATRRRGGRECWNLFNDYEPPE